MIFGRYRRASRRDQEKTEKEGGFSYRLCRGLAGRSARAESHVQSSLSSVFAMGRAASLASPVSTAFVFRCAIRLTAVVANRHLPAELATDLVREQSPHRRKMIAVIGWHGSPPHSQANGPIFDPRLKFHFDSPKPLVKRFSINNKKSIACGIKLVK